MSTAIPPELREAAGRAAHAQRGVDSGNVHTPEGCPCKDGHDYSPTALHGDCTRCGKVGWDKSRRGCFNCDSLLRAWPDLTEAQREAFRASQDPALSVVAPVLADHEPCAACGMAVHAAVDRVVAAARTCVAEWPHSTAEADEVIAAVEEAARAEINK